jgi:TatD DNase family protein
MQMNDLVTHSPTTIIDTHCHYNLEPFAADWHSYWQKARENGVITSIIAGTDLETSRLAIAIAQQDPHLYAWAGVHPADGDLSQVSLPTTMRELDELLVQTKLQPGVHITDSPLFGIGEIGLDYFRLEPNDHQSRLVQRSWLRAQLELAQKHELPVSLHVRDKNTPDAPVVGNAYWDVWMLLQELSFTQPFILHCASGPLSFIKVMLTMGAYVSFAGNLTYPKAEAIRQIAQLVPVDHRLVETDAPYLPPQPWRGQTCEPWMVSETAKMLLSL